MTSTPSDDIHALIVAAQSGQREAMDALCTRLYPRVQTIAHNGLELDVRRQRPWLHAMLSTGDIVQEIFMGVINDLDDFRGQSEGELCAFVATLTKNRLIDAIRFHEASRRDGRRSTNYEGTTAAGPTPEEAATAQDEILRFHRVLRSFGERDRTLLRERLEHRTPYEELANLLGYASADSARKAFHVAQARLIVRLEESS